MDCIFPVQEYIVSVTGKVKAFSAHLILKSSAYILLAAFAHRQAKDNQTAVTWLWLDMHVFRSPTIKIMYDDVILVSLFIIYLAFLIQNMHANNSLRNNSLITIQGKTIPTLSLQCLIMNE